MRAQRLMDLVGLRVAPALTGAIIAYLHAGAVGEGVLVFLTIFAAAQIIERSRFRCS